MLLQLNRNRRFIETAGVTDSTETWHDASTRAEFCHSLAEFSRRD